ncbi:hypothetical protein BDA96_07G211700 [Sorghum bicolor]|uniref:Uncharacterized protein n=2 Tax=Sorghum bicolor TaxID=4558 RepID=A0A921UA45_SORBI|nr:uncharacterized protein LOC110436739 [Sorghum bicolor]KAG0524442.1 hypothetical protein BDA96_07G211700 [Sorghum bicolor]OQU80859.1 hypothetical protein SORBI_3007G199101 [Sorghum bicolor]|eukprot:XP_021319862.1 uncharacterized protein LOC110436739 [Sorghum bicolor]
MKMSKNKRRQQLGGKPVLVTFYVAEAEPRDHGGSASTATSSHGLGHHHHHHHHKNKQRQDHHHSHGDGPDMQRRRRKDGKSQSNRRADLLEYSRQLRASSARQTAATTATASPTPPPAPPPPRRDWDTSTAAVGVRRDERQRPPQAAVNRLERAMSQQNIRQRCFGGDDWSWKRLLVLVFPFHRRPRRSNRDGSEKNVNIINQTGRPAALLVGKLTTVSSKNRRERSGFLKTLMPSFQKRSR